MDQSAPPTGQPHSTPSTDFTALHNFRPSTPSRRLHRPQPAQTPRMAPQLYTVLLRTRSYLVSEQSAETIRAAQRTRKTVVTFDALRCCDCGDGTIQVHAEISEIRALVAHHKHGEEQPRKRLSLANVIPMFR